MPGIPVFAQCQHIVEGTVFQQLLCFADAEPEQAGVNEFFILGFIMAVLMGTVACHESHHMALVIASGNQHAGMRLQGHLGGIHFRLFCLPEGMILRQCKAGECLHGPVGRTGGVVPFRHQQTWVAVANGQHAIPGENGLAEPLPHVAQQQMLHLSVADRFAFCFRQGLGCIESTLSKAIGQASAVGQCFAGTVKPAGKVSCH